MYNPFSLEGKTILVTGASSGIGKATAIECSKLGAKVVITGRNEERLEKTLQLLEGESNIKIKGDLCDENFRKSLVEQSPQLDGLVHCAGITNHVPIQFVNSKKLNETLSINFLSPVYITAELLKMKKMNKKSSIVFISSTTGVFVSYTAESIYGSTKGAINGFVKGMALDVAAKKIRVNTVCPAMVDTDILKEGIITEEQVAEDIKKYPLKRYGKPEEIAYAVIYLLSDASSWVTGSNIVIDGGYTLL